MIVDKMIDTLWDAVHPNGLGSNDCEKIEAALRAGKMMRDVLQEYMDGVREEGGSVDSNDLRAIAAWDAATREQLSGA